MLKLLHCFANFYIFQLSEVIVNLFWKGANKYQANAVVKLFFKTGNGTVATRSKSRQNVPD